MTWTQSRFAAVFRSVSARDFFPSGPGSDEQVVALTSILWPTEIATAKVSILGVDVDR